MTFPSGRLAPGWDRRLVIAGYVTFTVAAPTVLVSGPEQLGCEDCPANVFLIENKSYTMPIGLRTYIFQFDANYGWLTAGAVIVTVPSMLVFLFAQRYLVSGLTRGGVKG